MDYFICYFLRFRAGVKDLEVMVQNLISSAFETITTVQEGVEILDIFQHLSSREVCVGHKYPGGLKFLCDCSSARTL